MDDNSFALWAVKIIGVIFALGGLIAQFYVTSRMQKRLEAEEPGELAEDCTCMWACCRMQAAHPHSFFVRYASSAPERILCLSLRIMTGGPFTPPHNRRYP
jgi:hypothetical protein